VRRHVPNLLTAGRFFMAIGFFIVLAFYDAYNPPAWPVLDLALAIFLVAVATDVVDGYLARRMGHMTTFGRIADPFVDKIMVCGALAYFIGGQFIQPGVDGAMENVTGWRPWMVVVILAREFLVTGMRSLVESQHMDFSAIGIGKAKLILQFLAILWTLVYVGHYAGAGESAPWARGGRDMLIWSATLLTLLSGIVYVKRAYVLLVAGQGD